MAAHRTMVPLVWAAVIFLALIGIAAAVRRSVVLLRPPGAVSAPNNPAAALDRAFDDRRTLTLLHIVPAMLFMILGPLQFVSTLRAEHPRIHRWSGRVFLTASAIVGVTGLTLAFGKTIGGVDEKAAVVLFGSFFLIALAKALWHALHREFAQHPRMDDSRLRHRPCGGHGTAHHGHVFCGRGPARSATGPARILRHGVLDRIHAANDRRRNLD
jgi:hypothetical protein